MRTMILAALLFAGCTTTGAPRGPIAIESEEIRYETGPCFGACPVYAITIRPDGSGSFDGKRFTAVTGPRSLRTDPATYRRFAAALAPYRPRAGEVRYAPGSELCGQPVASDLPSIDIRWSEHTGGPGQRLYFYEGCGTAANRAMRDALKAAPALLPIGDFIGRR